MSFRMDLTLEQARKIAAAAPADSNYYREACRVIREHGLPVVGQDAGVRQDDDDGYPD